MIHYHGTPISGPIDGAARFLAGRHAFVSFARPEQIDIVAEACQSFAIDNGAFSAWTRGHFLNVPAYVDWVRQWERHPGFDWAIIPDVIDGSERDNDRQIEAWPLPHGVPVWHLHESTSRLQALASAFTRVALGSSGAWATPGSSDWWARMGVAMDAICDDAGRPMTRLHGLRMLDPSVFTHLPLSSADSTNASRNAGATSRFRIYAPINAWQRAALIADRIEHYNSSAAWDGRAQHALGL